MQEVVIAGYLRTPHSRSKPGDPAKDWFHQLRADELLAAIVPELLDRTGIDSIHLDDFIVGSAMGVKEQWTFGGRTPVFLSNLSERVPAKFIDQQCGSGMAAVQVGFAEIATGCADIVLAAGMEHMTRVPMGPTLFDEGVISLNQALSRDARYRHWDMETGMNMGLTAEKLSGMTRFSRQDLDRWGLRSHQLAAKAVKDGFFAGEILPITARQQNGSTLTVDHDQSVREDVSEDKMAALRPVFWKDGVVTAGNASPLNAAAAAMVLMSSREAAKRGICPMAKIRSIGFAGVDPTLMGKGPVPAVQKALRHAGLKADSIDYWEINEAFAIVALYCMEQLGIDPETVNVMGGSIAIGHPLGATGVRLVGTLARILAARGGRLGCATACVGGGQGVATVIERMKQ